MIYIGIDPSINYLGMTIYDGENEFFYIVKPNKLSKAEEQFAHAYKTLNYVLYDKDTNKHEQYWEKEQAKLNNLTNIVTKVKQIIDSFDGIKMIGIEGISYASKSSNLTDLSGLNWMLRCALKDNSSLYIFSPSEIKKSYTGSGNANKDMMSQVFLGIHPEFRDLPKVDDLADSHAIMLKLKFHH